MKKVFVIGAHGHVGRQLVPKLAKAGYQVMAGMRKDSEFSSLPKSDAIQPIHFDLTADPAQMKQVFQNHPADAVVFSAGAGGGVTPSQTINIDLDGAAKSMKAARDAGIHRYIMVSAAGSDNRKVWKVSNIYTYYLAKHYADLYLRNSGLDYTILHPVALSNQPETKQIQLNPNHLNDTSVPRADVANVIVAVLNDNQTIHHEYTFSSGKQNIDHVI